MAARTGSLRPALFLDRDGVCNRLLPGAYVLDYSLFEWLPRAREALALARRYNWSCIVVTNQAGVGRGLQTHEALDEVHRRMAADVAASGGRIEAVHACPHAPDAGCACRKPEPGLLLAAAAEHGLDLTASWMVGDSETDAIAADRAGVRWLYVRSGRPAGATAPDPPWAAGRACADLLDAVLRIGPCPAAHGR